MLITYWLYFNDRPIDAVRLPRGATAEEVRRKAIESHDRVPLHAPHNDYHRSRLKHATVQTFHYEA